MTGYLYRKALSVLHPGTSIHPVVRPIFSMPGPRDAPDISLLMEENEQAAEPAPPHGELAPDPPAPRTSGLRAGPTPSQRLAETRAEPHEPDPRPAPPPRSDSPRAKAARDAPGNLFPMPQERSEATPSAAPSAARRGTAIGPSNSSEAEPVVPAPLFAPLQSPQRALASVRVAADQPAPQAVPQTTSGLPRKRPAASRDPEEVQIHIGRIEVTAMPPEPARTALRPQRTALPLGEYLRRRDGRA
jgi:hypothetical protein